MLEAGRVRIRPILLMAGTALAQSGRNYIYIVGSSTFQPFSPEVGDAVAAVDGVAVVSRLAISPAAIGDAEAPGAVEVGPTGSFGTGIDPATLERAVALTVDQGTLADLGPGAVAVDLGTADSFDLEVGSTVPITWSTEARDYKVVATYEASGPLTGPLVGVTVVGHGRDTVLAWDGPDGGAVFVDDGDGGIDQFELDPARRRHDREGERVQDQQHQHRVVAQADELLEAQALQLVIDGVQHRRSQVREDDVPEDAAHDRGLLRGSLRLRQ